MFYKLIENKRNEWLSSSGKAVIGVIDYIISRSEMRDAQIEAIKTYLYLKIACKNAPLWKLFANGTFNSLDLDKIPLSTEARQLLSADKAAAALLEYSRLTDRYGKQLAPELERFITEHPRGIDYVSAFRKIFYDVSYSDYLFSLPMGAGKTYLMAAFIYLDLYFAQNEPDNPAFAHNFMVMAPSGTKSSIVPSLKTILSFDPSWVVPEPAASELRRLIKFEVLEENKAAKKSNTVRNPNAQKINSHQPLENLLGLVAIVNAEKVILDRVDDDERHFEYGTDEWKSIFVPNELRHIIGKIPNLAVFIDEVHHASESEIKLRQVVNGWAKNNTFNCVLGFSGTPYLEKAEKLELADNYSIKNAELSNVVYYYPLINGVGNFLKIPEIKYAEADTATIVHNGVHDFLDKYKDTVYADGTCAKLAIYCMRIETLEERIFPQVSEIVSSYGMNPSEVILKFYGKSKTYPLPASSKEEFASLDTVLSRKRIVLLAQIGKEGWDCKSLTGVVLPQQGACPTNMVLQTSCRCLRQVIKNEEETAIVWLNKHNADILNRQLQQQQNISISELNGSGRKKEKRVERFSRIEKQHLPPVDFYQLRISYSTVVESGANTSERLKDKELVRRPEKILVYKKDISWKDTGADWAELETGEQANYNQWLLQIVKESFNALNLKELKRYDRELRTIFSRVTTEQGGNLFFNNEFNQQEIRSRIRCAFIPRRDFSVKEETVPCRVRLLQIEKLVSPVYVESDEPFYPPQNEVYEIMEWDKKVPGQELSSEALAAIELLRA